MEINIKTLAEFAVASNETIFLEWVNHWRTIPRMAKNFGIEPIELEAKINAGRKYHYTKHNIQ